MLEVCNLITIWAKGIFHIRTKMLVWGYYNGFITSETEIGECRPLALELWMGARFRCQVVDLVQLIMETIATCKHKPQMPIPSVLCSGFCLQIFWHTCLGFRKCNYKSRVYTQRSAWELSGIPVWFRNFLTSAPQLLSMGNKVTDFPFCCHGDVIPLPMHSPPNTCTQMAQCYL